MNVWKVLQSLSKRNGFGEDKFAALWLKRFCIRITFIIKIVTKVSLIRQILCVWKTGESMLNVAWKRTNQRFSIRSNSVWNAADAVANDVHYHLKCWVNAQWIVISNENCDPIQEMDNKDALLPDTRVINIVHYDLFDYLNVIWINNVNTTYNNSLWNSVEN